MMFGGIADGGRLAGGEGSRPEFFTDAVHHLTVILSGPG